MFDCEDVERVRSDLSQELGGAELSGRLAQDQDSGAFLRFRELVLPPGMSAGVNLALVEYETHDSLQPLAAATVDERAAVSRIDHVVVMTRSPERAIALYRDRLGIRLALDRSFEKRGVRLLFFRLGGATLEVGARLDAGAAEGDDHLFGLALQVPDARAAHARLAAEGLELTRVRDGHKPGTRVFTVQEETEGVPTLMIEPVAS